MERNFAAELDTLKQQMNDMKGMLARVLPPQFDAEKLVQLANSQQDANFTAGQVEKMTGMHPDARISSLISDLEDHCGENGSTGRITYMGVFASGGRQSTWVKNDLNTDDLLPLIENRTAEKVLACVGNNDRLNMLLAILRKPRTVAELVSDCGYSSTGQVYHHLKPLLAADLVAEDLHRRGSYIIQPHRVQGLIMLLAAIADLIDSTYTHGQIE
ncbi:MAG: helix-turn-helix transcriptional regulator [Clostridiales bacterium]|nr:helix-turn-helix transcriptional regulator [Clostridiales bacterium]